MRDVTPMLDLERGFAVFALAQIIIATLRAGSRALYLLHDGKIGVMQGPLILPPKANETTSQLWELATAFRESVKLALDREEYDVDYVINDVALPRPKTRPSTRTSTGYSLSPYASVWTEDDTLDEQIELILEEAEKERENEAQSMNFGAERVKRFASVTLSALVLPVARASIYTALVSRSAWQWALRGWRHDEELLEFLEEEIESLDSDFHVSLEADVILGSDLQKETMSPSKSLRRTWIARIAAYAPNCFADLRSLFGISEEAFRKSILESGPFVSFQSNSKGAARVGGVFFFTRDGAYMIKTIKRDEVQTLLDMLPKYYQFMKRNGRRSLLTRFCGMYDVTIGEQGSDAKPRTFVVMNSVFPAEASKFLSERFDLKGSTVGRECSLEEREAMGRNAVLKDLNLAREVELVRSIQRDGRSSVLQRDGYGLGIGPTAKAALMTQLRRDVKLLAACQVIDYSLLVGVVKDSKAMEERDLRLIDQNQDMELRMRLLRRRTFLSTMLSAIIAPTRILVAPPLFLWRNVWSAINWAFWRPLPYYGSGECLVDAGRLSHMAGTRMGRPAIYYFGLIDFLQPFNTKKLIEYRAKSMLYESGTYSCVPPEEYADRFLAFLDEHIT